MTAASLPAGLTAEAIRNPRLLSRVLHRPLAAICIVYLTCVVGIAIIAPIAMPSVGKEDAGDLTAVRQAPSSHHLLGTDTLGRDVLDRLLVGSRPALVGVAEGLAVVLLLGVPVGLAAGFYRGWIDRIVSWLSDLTFSMPTIIVVLVVLSVFPQSMLAAMCTFGAIVSPGLMRVVRAATLAVREELYIAAARVSGFSQLYIIRKHVLPRVMGPIIVQASLLSAVALLVQAGLSFLNLVVAPPAPSWGGMIADGVSVLEVQAWLIWPPGIAIALTVLAFGLLGDAVRDAASETWSGPARRISRTPKRISTLIDEPRSMTDSKESLLRVRDLTVAFQSEKNPVPVVQDVTFDVRRGETVGIVGESGSGKTVTALALIGLLPGTGTIEAGSIELGGTELIGLPERSLRRLRGKEIGFISQEPMVGLNPALRVGWQLAEAIRYHRRVSRQVARTSAIELLRRVHLPDADQVARKYPHELSGGMAQRVAIARAIAGEPRLLIADEPTTALDVTVQAEILELLRELQRDRGMAILLITHDWGVVADICDRAVVMYAGQVVERADLVPMFREPLHPYTEALLASNPHNAVDEEKLPVIPGGVPKPGAWPDGCHFHPRCGYATEGCRNQLIPLRALGTTREARCIHSELLQHHL